MGRDQFQHTPIMEFYIELLSLGKGEIIRWSLLGLSLDEGDNQVETVGVIIE